LVDQGKDVSRALKNRCLQIHVRYDPHCDASESLLGTEVEILEGGERLMQMNWDLAKIHQASSKSLIDTALSSTSLLPAMLGKRSKSEEHLVTSKMKQALGMNLD
jgi:hypothetical protein